MENQVQFEFESSSFQTQINSVLHTNPNGIKQRNTSREFNVKFDKNVIKDC